MPRICVVIPMFGKEEYTNKCVDMVRENYGTGEPIEILVVDDGSAKPYFNRGVNVIHLMENSGFTAAANAGILWAQYRNCDYVLLLNNDTEPHPNFLKYLLDIMEGDNSIGIASSARIYPKENLVELYGLDLIRGYQAVTKPENLKDEVVECNWVPLCSSLIRMDVIREVGLLNKLMRNHSSDLEYCLKVKMAHHKIVVVTKSQVIHYHEVTTSSNNITPEKDQRVLLEILAGLPYQQFMNVMPLDGQQKTYGRISFEVYKK